MVRFILFYYCIFTLFFSRDVRSFSISHPIQRWSVQQPFAVHLSARFSSSTASSGGSAKRMGELTPAEQTLYDFLCELSHSEYSFRIVVVGKSGSAILESTVPSLGPVIKITQSPSTGANMATFANEDQSFEYHVQLEQIAKIMLIEKETPKKVLRIIRLVNAAGDSMTSFILADSSEKANAWYHDLVQRRGSEILL